MYSMNLYGHSFSISALKEANNVYGGRVNVDLIFGRPNQSLDTWVAEIHEVH